MTIHPKISTNLLAECYARIHHATIETFKHWMLAIGDLDKEDAKNMAHEWWVARERVAERHPAMKVALPYHLNEDGYLRRVEYSEAERRAAYAGDLEAMPSWNVAEVYHLAGIGPAGVDLSTVRSVAQLLSLDPDAF